MKDVEELLSDYAFLRVHHSFMVNLNEIHKYIERRGWISCYVGRHTY